jgi:hypothetical protein
VHKAGSEHWGRIEHDMQGLMSILLLVSTEIPVHNGSPRGENLPDAARDLISNAPAKSASSAELRRAGSNCRIKAHVKVMYYSKGR